MSAFDQNFPPLKKQSNLESDSRPLDIELLKSYAINAVLPKEEDVKIWSLITNFPACELWVKVVLLILNVILPGILIRCWYNCDEFSI